LLFESWPKRCWGGAIAFFTLYFFEIFSAILTNLIIFEPEIVKKSKIAGSLINHSEHRISSNEIATLVRKLKDLKMISVVCVKNVAEAKKFAKLNPDYIAIEPPELIGSGRAVSKERPELITNAVKAVKGSKRKTKLLCGAGIISGNDVQKAIQLGAKGILVASGIVKAKNWNKIIEEFAKAML